MPPEQERWTIDVYQLQTGSEPVRNFLRTLEGRDKAEALALVKLLEEQGNKLRRPQSGTLGEGLFELRGKQVRIFYMFLPGRTVVLLDGEIKKQYAIPAKTLARMRAYQKEVTRRVRSTRR